ncbi:MAG TPA: cyclic peptide export ABC transporter, partial [Ruminiclostridium sp.]|nr:cyclic peptide export ABC transporter [Ruminiclostridium sp.]
FKNINDLTGGFKELYINRKKRYEFNEDIQKSCEDYRDTRVKGEYKFVGVMIMGEMMYTAVIGVVVFVFPLLFSSIQDTTLRNYVVVYLYMGGIVNQLINIVPFIVRVLVSWRRINGFIEEISYIEDTEQEVAAANGAEDLTIQFNGVTFRYKNENGEKFSIGPISYSFRSGEVTFISGGNGSGKSTFAKLLTGLYECDEGEIMVNGQKVDSKTLGSYFSTVYSGFHLFDKLYGVDYGQKEEEIREYLELLRISDKVKIDNGVFDTLRLSTGQRKRLALLVSYLEDRPAYLFDEWAADQDPEFRNFFYKTILPELRARGKAVIAITHDDRYFKEADRLIKMENGKIVEHEEFEELVSG